MTHKNSVEFRVDFKSGDRNIIFPKANQVTISVTTMINVQNVYAWWAYMHRFLSILWSVCLSVPGPKIRLDKANLLIGLLIASNAIVLWQLPIAVLE